MRSCSGVLFHPDIDCFCLFAWLSSLWQSVCIRVSFIRLFVSCSAARLLPKSDVKDVGYVIVSTALYSLHAFSNILISQNYDFPNNCEDYIHRIGRTGVGDIVFDTYHRAHHVLLQRAGLKGTSFTYFTTENAKSARDLIAILREAKAEVPPQLDEMAMYSGGGGGNRKSRTSAILLFPTNMLL